MDCSPASLLAAAADFRALSIRLLRAVITSEWGSYDSFDPAPCAVTGIADGGGDTFDCYDAGDYSSESLPEAGTGFSGLWLTVNSPFGNPYGDTFDTYPVGAAGTLNDGTGFSGAWIYS